MKPFFALFITNAVAANLWDKYAEADPEIDIIGQMVLLAERIPKGKKKLPLKNRFALYLYDQAVFWLDEKFEQDNGQIQDVKTYVQKFNSWYFAKYIQKIYERKKQDEKKHHEELEG